MKVLLRSDVVGVGRRGDIVEVRDGYARNYLLPQGVALGQQVVAGGPSADHGSPRATMATGEDRRIG